MKRVAGLFEQEQEADLAIKSLQNAGFYQDKFGALARDQVIKTVSACQACQYWPIRLTKVLGFST
jgi:hypothetical protein